MPGMERTAPGRALASLLATLLVLGIAAPAGAAGGAPSAEDPVAAGLEPGPAVTVPPPDLPSALATLLAGLPVVAPPPRLPRCEYRDDPTRYDATREWRHTLLDTNLRLDRSYEPWDLVPVSRAGLAGSGQVRQLMIEDLAALASAARAAGKPLAVRSAYRSFQAQEATFAMWARRSGYEQALKFSARPGHSEHQLGTTIDFTTAPGEPLSSTFGESPAGKWLARNGWQYGFVMSYPEGQRRVSCYGYEPWHWRYVGRSLARQIQESGQVPRRFLWENYESRP